MAAAGASAPQAGEEERVPLRSSTAASTDPPARLDSQSSTVADLREQLVAIQQRLEGALRLQARHPSKYDKHAGHVDVDFVRTKPSKRHRLRCKKGANVKTILHQFHAEFPEGCVTALMGPSGAGKTTLLDFLTGMLGDSVHASGQVALPDNDAYVPQDDRLHAFYSCRTYMQHYARLRGMTPLLDCCKKRDNDHEHDSDDDEDDEEAAQLGGTSPKEKDVDALIAKTLDQVGLTNQTDTVVGGMFTRGLSGGQKRRLSVALEALSSPLNLFLDEPTSGLDSESALALMTYLQKYARGKDPATGRRRRVIVTIHQPSSQIWEELIDNVVLLAEGRLMYQGPREEMDNFFGAFGHPCPVHYNPADHFIEALFKTPDMAGEDADEESEALKTSEMWSRCFNQWSKFDDDDDEEEAGDTFRENAVLEPAKRPELHSRRSIIIRRDPRETSKRERVKAVTKKNNRSAIELTRRSFVSLLKNPVVLFLRVAIYGGMSLMIGILFFDLASKTDMHSIQVSRTALLYFIIAFCSSMSVAVIPFAMVDRAIVEKEVRNHLYHPAFYHLSQALASIPVCLVLSVLVTVIVLAMTGLKGTSGPAVILFLTFLCADAVSMFVAHISPELISAICIASGIFGVFTMVMGFLVTPSSMPTGFGWLYYIPFMTYSFRSLMHIQYSDLRIPLDEFDLTDSPYSQMIDQVDTTFLNNTEIEFEGETVLRNFEMADVSVSRDMIILVIWAVAMHAVSLLYLCWSNYKGRRIFIYSDD